MPRKPRGERPLRGGSDSARARGLTGVVVHLTREERALVGAAAGRAVLPVKEYARRAVVEAAARDEGRNPQRLS
jgi:hypothetical protein